MQVKIKGDTVEAIYSKEKGKKRKGPQGPIFRHDDRYVFVEKLNIIKSI